jgi:hypothetical protein
VLLRQRAECADGRIRFHRRDFISMQIEMSAVETGVKDCSKLIEMSLSWP